MNQFKLLVLFIPILFITIANGKVFASDNSAKQISVNFSNIKIRDLLTLLTENSHKNIIISEKIKGKITINLHKASWREILDVVLQTQGLVKRETANVIIIAPPDEVDKKERDISKPAAFNLHHTSADSIAKVLGPGGVLSQTGKAGAEIRTNMLLVSDTSDRIESVKNLIKKVDVPVKQVLIEARIVSADENFARDLGLEFGLYHAKETDKSDGNQSTADLHQGRFNFAIARLSNNSLLDLELAALESEGRGRVISNPKLLTTDRQAAYIESGEEIPYQEKTKEGDTDVVFKKAVLSLKVTPEVIAENAVNLLLQLNQDKVSQLTVGGVPAINTRKIQTQVSVRSGETVVLGGIYEWSKSRYVTGVPFFAKIPLFGMLFRRQEDKVERKELLMFVTPRIIRWP